MMFILLVFARLKKHNNFFCSIFGTLPVRHSGQNFLVMFDLSFALDCLIDALNDVVYSNNSSLFKCIVKIDALEDSYLHNSSKADAANELNAAVYASYIINSDVDNLEFNAKMFFKYYDALLWKSDLIKIVSNRVTYLISKPIF